MREGQIKITMVCDVCYEQKIEIRDEGAVPPGWSRFPLEKFLRMAGFFVGLAPKETLAKAHLHVCPSCAKAAKAPD